MAFSPDGALLVTGGYQALQLWRAGDGALEGELPLPDNPGEATQIQSVHFSADGALLATGGFIASTTNPGTTTPGVVHVWRMADKTLLQTIAPPDAGVSHVRLSPDGSLLATAGSGERVRLWRVSDGELLREQAGHTNVVNAVLFTPDGRRLITAGNDGVVRFWDVAGSS